MTRIYNVQFKKILIKVKSKILEVFPRVVPKGIAEKKDPGISAAEKKEMNRIYNKIVGAPRDW